MLFLITMLGTSVYAFLCWDLDAFSNVIHWLNPAENLFVRVIALIGLCLAEFAGVMKEGLTG